MFISMTDIVITVLGLIALIVWIVFFLKGNKYSELFGVLDEKEFPFKDIFGVGYAFMETIHYKFKSKADRKLRQELEILYGQQYVDYYMRIVYAQKTTYAMTLLVISFALYGLSQEVAAMGVGFMFSGLAYYYFGVEPANKIRKRSEEMLSDFSEVVSQLALLTNAGMILKEAWETTAYSGTSTIYVEMQKAVVDIKNGMMEVDAYHAFGKRCVIPEIKKVASTIVQGLTKGNSELTLMLQEQSKEVWNIKKQNVRRQGEKASSKLLIPICIMFVGILIMIIVPIFTNIGA